MVDPSDTIGCLGKELVHHNTTRGNIKIISLVTFVFMSFEVFTAVKMPILFWVVTPCGFVGRYQPLGET
jgi:hypothetical protein